MNSPFDILLNQVGQIAALATVCEVKMRILADNTPILDITHKHKMTPLPFGFAGGIYDSGGEIQT